jgi:dATP pyrophosphohydrolase
MRRTHDRIWNVPAGQIEDDESFADGAARELQEEAGLVATLTPLGDPRDYVVEDAYRHLYASGAYTVTIQGYASQAPSGWEPRLNHEHSEYRWCSFDEALALLHWPEAKDALRTLAERLKVA